MLSLPKPRASRNSVVGLDIEPGAVHAACVSVNGGLRIERHASIALDPGVVRDGEVVEIEALGEALTELFAEHKLGRAVRIGVANQRVVMRHILLPPITDPKELATAVRFEAESIIPMPLDQVVLDHASLGVVETSAGPRERVLVVAARRDMVERLLAAASAAKLRPEGIDMSAFALARALASPADGLVVHLSVGGVVNVAATRGMECVFSRTVPGGLEAMALDLAERCGLTAAQARVVLRSTPVPADPPPMAAPMTMTAAPSLAAEDDAPVVPERKPEEAPGDTASVTAGRVLEEGVRRIATEVRNSIDFHLAGDEAALAAAADGQPATVERVVVTGPAIAVPGLSEALAAQLGIPVVLGDVAGADPDAPGSHAVAAGLAIEELAA